MTCLESVQKKIDFKPEVALILGSGLGDFADGIKIEQTIDYTDIEGFPVSTVKGHKGRFVFGYVEETPVVIMQGRVHYYEGYDMTDVVLPTRLMGMMGAKKILLTNAAGGAAALLGFGSPGIAAGSVAASAMSAAWTTGIGTSLVSAAQSAGALFMNAVGGSYLAATAAVAAPVVVGGAVGYGIKKWMKPKK